ncbi:hypothetical protein [Jeotgalibacillus malaysiensis]
MALYMEAVNHWALSRSELKAFAEESGFAERLHVLEDGDFYTC